MIRTLLITGMLFIVKMSDFPVYSNKPESVMAMEYIDKYVPACDRFVMSRICTYESGWNPYAVSSTGDYGICQINLRYHPEVDPDSVFDYRYNIRQGYRIMCEARKQGIKPDNVFYGLRR